MPVKYKLWKARSLLAAVAVLAASELAIAAPESFQAIVLADEPLLYYQFNEAAGNIIKS